MKISEIKSEEVREEAVRLAKIHSQRIYQFPLSTKQVSDMFLFWAFPDSATEYPEFWQELRTGKIANTPDLKLPNL